jgi:hypothetical protein
MTFLQYLYLKEATNVPITFGDLKQAIINVSNRKLAGNVAGKVARAGLSFIPGAGAAVGAATDLGLTAGEIASDVAKKYLDPNGSVIGVLKKFMKVADNVRGNNILSKLDIDDEASVIVADDIEDNFAKYIIEVLNNFPNNQVIPPGWSMTKELIRYLSNTYKGRTLSVPEDLKTLSSAPATPLPPEFS